MSTKQEQREAQTKVEQVAPGALRMQLPIVIPGLRHVNMYCFPDERGATVIDPGLPDDATWAAIRERLKEADLEVRHVHTVVVTHSHPDHFGGAARFHEASGARVIAHESFSVFGERLQQAEPEVSVEYLQPRAVVPLPEETLRAAVGSVVIPWGGAPPTTDDRDRRQWERIKDSAKRGMIPPVTHVVRDGDKLRLGERDFTVVHSPGHTGDHICFYDREAGTFIAGDHVLPSITPHISGLTRVHDPLQAFFDSLDRTLELRDVQRCLPAHGDPFDDLAGRVEAIKRHHRERLNKLVSIAHELGKPATVREFSQVLFSERAWGIMAESETYAHLEHLRLRGRAESHRQSDGMLLFEA
ncbi:MAG TPA: MBL fold metallo-hydrolase [Polyangiales bacterium]|nr:MBL fold metallo-hydrolase [Polyangiales bacterium]